MAKIARKNQLIFGSNAGLNQRAVFGSLAAGVPAFSTDVETIQSLAEYLEGWFGAAVGANSPAEEDMNSLLYVYAYQLTYLFQNGIPEWNTSAIYYIGSFASDGLGNFYVSLTDTNTGNALSDTTKWKNVIQNPSTVITSAAGTTTLTNKSCEFQTIIGTTTQTVKLPDASTCTNGIRFVIANFSTGLVTVNNNDNSFRTEVYPNSSITLTLVA